MYNYFLFDNNNNGDKMKSNKKNQTIKCNVKTCKYNCEDENLCDLDCISVSCNCNNDECSCKKETICDSFKEK